ncbi:MULTISPECIES: nitrous oxide reductase accessory protein NosL [unclassified Tenacibaculum]|uniref:nitrous oxide reductase accessory protein NosL n=1 Tax=unclassified Tenacibaculum TaxID=2635139 RepID=UPI001F2DB85E|nr:MULTISPECIES: nitrous oxide reductase accessory protein NosL [unclassified Tenacibaculum]MCF2875851.1 nitrous oxide reductase accessory protein NosL [Tenacibaculum sp. Cn5-1]MCF2935926.1 nitrous oxide reductase accessory protein NosL [Tenacibaculum sp. Cn5-34]MCG7512487.1 nitrous oxide reductase accessory protein NosL [Tenacibaculum sp. Cn5-46]
MKAKYYLFCLIVVLFLNKTAISQNQDSYNQCIQCNMLIKDKLHNAQATTNTNKVLNFDAIECLANYLKEQKTTSISNLTVADYNSGKQINAITATYLISNAIKSPMGANLSAFKTKKEAELILKTKKGKLYTWQEIRNTFNTNKIGHTEHHHEHHNRPDAHAPIGVMGDHLHSKNGFMVSFRYMNMEMDGNRSGTSTINNTSIFNTYMVAPQNMTMDMYMLGVMYAPSDKLTLMLMQNFVRNKMNLKARMMMGGNTMFRDFSTSSSGFGDLKLGALYSIYNKMNTSIHLNGTLNIPIGNIKQKDDTPMMQNAKLPYAMQLGSGTFDITLGATYKGNTEYISWGVQPLFTFRTGTNSQDYRLGNTQQINIWGAYKVANWISISGRVLGISQGKISGRDTELNPMMVPTANTNNYGGEKIKTFLGFNLMFNQNSSLKNFRIGIEAGAPIYENYNGIQMDEDLSFQLGIKYAI